MEALCMWRWDPSRWLKSVENSPPVRMESSRSEPSLISIFLTPFPNPQSLVITHVDRPAE